MEMAASHGGRRNPTKQEITAELDALQRERDLKEGDDGDGKIIKTGRVVGLGKAIFKVLDFDNDGDIGLEELVYFPRALFVVLQIIFGASKRAIPLGVMISCGLAIISCSLFSDNLTEAVSIMEAAFKVHFRAVPRALAIFIPCIVGVDSMVLLHGTIVAARRSQSYLCGPKGRIGAWVGAWVGGQSSCCGAVCKS